MHDLILQQNASFIQKVPKHLFYYKVHTKCLIADHRIQQMSPTLPVLLILMKILTTFLQKSDSFCRLNIKSPPWARGLFVVCWYRHKISQNLKERSRTVSNHTIPAANFGRQCPRWCSQQIFLPTTVVVYKQNLGGHLSNIMFHSRPIKLHKHQAAHGDSSSTCCTCWHLKQ